MSECGNKLLFEQRPDGRYHLAQAWLCRDRLCPVCAWRLSIKRTAEMLQTCALMAQKYPQTRAIHVVLTVRSVPGEELRSEIAALSAAFARLRRRKLWREYILGYARSIEVTYNQNRDTYHPHIHVVAIVPANYGRQITYGDWVSLWRACARLQYNPIVWAKHAYTAETELHDYEFPEITAKAAIVEAMKYAVKPDDMMRAIHEGGIMELGDALHGWRLVSFGGILKEIRAELGLSDDEEQLPETELDPEAAIDRYRVCYQWAASTSCYVRSETPVF